MNYSNSSINCFADCEAKYKYRYIDKLESCQPPSIHLIFGAMAHEVLYKAGQLRDMSADKVLTKDDYISVIPSECLYPELKDAFNITSWNNYFVPVIKQTALYEKQLCDSMEEPYEIKREHKITVNNIPGMLSGILGIIDLLILGKDSAIIVDYKFSKSKKTQYDFDLGSQLPLYAYLVHKTYGIPVRNIQVAYIDINKTQFDMPVVLKNGTLSRSKSQNTSQEYYKAAVEAIHKDDPYYNCEKGGFYYDIYCELALNKPAYLNCQYIDVDIYNQTMNDLFDTIKCIEFREIVKQDLPWPKKFDSYSCPTCEYVKYCKPQLFVEK